MVTADFEEPFEEDNELNLNDFEVTRTEFFAHTREPSFIFNDGKVGVNTACVRRLPDVDYVQLLINRNKRKLVFHSMGENQEWKTSSQANYRQDVLYEGLRHDGMEPAIPL